jgi:hypothetical protein
MLLATFLLFLKQCGAGHHRLGDLVWNPLKGKKLTEHRRPGNDQQ